MQHITVLQEEAVASLKLSTAATVVDCTLGSGGHARAILSHLGKAAHYIGFDADPTAITANQSLTDVSKAKVSLVHGNFRNLESLLSDIGVTSVDAILADLGWRSEQFSGATELPRGFSFQVDEPLHMTFGHPRDYAFTAFDIINDWAEEDIANVIYAYGEERASRRIARAIVATRAAFPIETSVQLAEVVAEALPPARRRGRTHPATKTFQALRIAVNDEFDALSELLQSGIELLTVGGRMAVISFHSLEDRIVKQTFKSFVHDQTGVLVTKKPLAPTIEEIRSNPRARSAKLRTIEKI